MGITLRRAPTSLRRRSLFGLVGLAAVDSVFGACAPVARKSASVPSVAGGGLPLHLDLNENPWGPSPRAVDAIRGGLDHLARYTRDEASALTRQIADYEGVATDQVILGDVLETFVTDLALRGGPGGEFVYSVPGYALFADTAQRAGGRPIEVPLDVRLNNDLDALERTVSARSRALFVVNPHNPSGTVSDPTALAAMLRRVSRTTPVLVDEAYVDFVDDWRDRTCVRLTREVANVAVFRTFSKLHGLAALSFGYLIASIELVARLRNLGLGNPRSLIRLAVIAASASLGDEDFLSKMRKRIAIERALWEEALGKLGLRRTQSFANFVFFETGRAHLEFSAAMRAAGIEIGRSFPPRDRWARISIGLPEENALARSAVDSILH